MSSSQMITLKNLASSQIALNVKANIIAFGLTFGQMITLKKFIIQPDNTEF
jgi:hypothetical protein